MAQRPNATPRPARINGQPKVTVQGFMSKDGTLRANARDIVFPDGKQLFIGSSGTGAPDERPEQ